MNLSLIKFNRIKNSIYIFINIEFIKSKNNLVYRLFINYPTEITKFIKIFFFKLFKNWCRELFIAANLYIDLCIMTLTNFLNNASRDYTLFRKKMLISCRSLVISKSVFKKKIKKISFLCDNCHKF